MTVDRGDSMSLEPLVLEFEVGVAPAEAFDIWTRRCATWWPAAHTVTGDPAAITFEPHAGGRIVERARDGGEHDWGTVLDWDPPTRLRYRWHLFFEPDEATEVEVTFARARGGTVVRLEQRGWEALGETGPDRRTRTHQAWSTLSAGFIRLCDAAAPR